MENLTAIEKKVLNNVTEVLNPDVELGTLFEEMISEMPEEAFTEEVHDEKDHTGLTGIPPMVEVDTPVNAKSAKATLTISSVSIHGEIVTIGDDIFEFAADEAQTVSDPGNIPVDITAHTVKGSVTLTVAAQPTSGDMMTIGTKVYTFVPVGTDTADGEISIGDDLEEAQENIVAAINGDGAFNLPHPLVSAEDFANDACAVTALIGGTAGNSIASTKTFASGSNVFSADHLEGGGNCSGANTITDLTEAINTDGTQGITAVAGDGKITLTVDEEGEAGNLIPVSDTMANGEFGVGVETMKGGVDAKVGIPGTICVDDTNLYIAVDFDTWKKVTLSGL